jgi:hypothetical protein
MSLRNQQIKPTKRHDVPYGWKQPTAPNNGNEYIFALFEAVALTPTYDGNEHTWDPVMEVLNLPLCYQPAIAKVLLEGRWRGKENPKAYVGTAAYRQGLRGQLKEFPSREFKVINATDTGSHCNHGFEPTESHDHDERVSDRDGVGDSQFPDGFPVAGGNGQRRNGKAFGFDDYDYDDRSKQIPTWLQHPEDPDRVNWDMVAKHAALKVTMVPTLALALNLRFRDRLGRDEAIRKIANLGLSQNVEAAYKWIDRNTATRIAPLFHLQKCPAPRPKATKPGKATNANAFTPPWVALSKTSRKPLHGDRALSGLPRPSFRLGGPPHRSADNAELGKTDLYVPTVSVPTGLKITWSRSWYGLTVTICEEETGRDEEIVGNEVSELVGILNWFIAKWNKGEDVFADDWYPDDAPTGF